MIDYQQERLILHATITQSNEYFRMKENINLLIIYKLEQYNMWRV